MESGNLIDRLMRGFVIDYIDITPLFNFPVFNFADICIVIGAVLVSIGIMKGRNNEKAYSTRNR